MTEEKIAKQSCDDIVLLISRNLDGDLDRSETLILYKHISSCIECRKQLSQISALGDSMDDLQKLYQGHSPGPQFRQSIYNAILEKKRDNVISSKTTFHSSKFWRWPFSPPGFKPYLRTTGIAFVVCFCVLFLWQNTFEEKLSPERLIIHKIPLRSAEDTVNWNHQHTILPFQVVRLNIRESSPDPYYFHVSSLKPVDFSLVHNQKKQDFENFKKIRLQGVQYFILKNPQSQDVIHITNHGEHPVFLKTSSYSSQAIQASFE